MECDPFVLIYGNTHKFEQLMQASLEKHVYVYNMHATHSVKHFMQENHHPCLCMHRYILVNL